ncbi:MAG TPA: S41 family peptidase [Actinophytocola sp.]|uniref:S41 family peptidase n=1 Tax=Actinophytocola sp. TaxID=1872138 RepID=UPI002DBBCFFC|nr:S41 family peptidase [Actinophytocola sp.]HEU5471917.1 S41 family peptidase [Actinophytocola sp.]
MPEFRAFATQRALTDAGRRTLVDQAEILVEGLYVHLPLKRAMHAVDPVQRLRLLRHRPALPEDRFHAELLRIFLSLSDLHTNYILPDRYRGFAFLGVLIEQYEDDSGPHWIVSKVFDHLVGDPNLTVGAELTHWNGMPMAIAVERNAEREAGSNEAARLARGLENMTLRAVRMSLPPDEDWVELAYTANGTAHQTRIPWRVFDSADEVTAGAPALPAGLSVPGTQLVGLDLRTELVRRAKRTLFAPTVAKEVARVARGRSRVPRATAAQVVAGVVPTTRPEELLARTVDTADGTFGHLRIFTFHMADGQVGAFVEEVARLLSVLPPDGLILDVRGNGGGYLIAAEFLLQFLTPGRVRPEPMQFVNTEFTADLCRRAADFGAWRASIEESVRTAAQYSAALPLYSEDLVNIVGQIYHGPVVLITDALCYSATDIFAAGFQDNGIGPVLGVADNTGAGGANVLTHADLRALWTKGPLRALPGGAEFRVALRRSLRVGTRFGQPVEDLGVVPDIRYRLTRRDLLERNADLMAKAGEILSAGTPRTLAASVVSATADTLTLAVTTKALSSLDIYAGPRPVLTTPVQDGANQIALPAPPTGSTLRLEGFDGDTLAAAQVLPLS